LILASIIIWRVVYARGRPTSETLVSRAREAVKARHWPLADELLTHLAAERRLSAGEIGLQAEVELGLGRSDKAVNLLRGIPGTDPEAARARLVAGQIETARNLARSAEALFMEALRLDPKLAPARRQLILLYAKQGRRAELNAQYRALCELEPLDFDDVFLWTNTFENLWFNDTIKSSLEGILAADPEDRLSRLALVGVLVRSNQFGEAEAVLAPLSETDPDARVYRARIALGRMRLEEVHAILDEGPADHPGLALLRGQLAVQENQFTVAARQFRIALRREPDNREALQNLSAVLNKLGDAQGASEALEKADHWRHLTSLLQKSRTFNIRKDKTLLLQIGQACEAVRQFPEARAWYRLALVEDPLDPAVQQALFRVRDRAL
jgi:tetratricopeptide (TPR) repeat protein